MRRIHLPLPPSSPRALMGECTACAGIKRYHGKYFFLLLTCKQTYSLSVVSTSRIKSFKIHHLPKSKKRKLLEPSSLSQYCAAFSTKPVPPTHLCCSLWKDNLSTDLKQQ